MKSNRLPRPAKKIFSDSGFTVIRGCWWLLISGIALGMGYLWIHGQVVDASHRLNLLEKRVLDLKEHTAALQVSLEKLKAPAVIKAELEQRKLDLVVPLPEQIVRIQQVIDYRPDAGPLPARPEDLVLLSVAR